MGISQTTFPTTASSASAFAGVQVTKCATIAKKNQDFPNYTHGHNQSVANVDPILHGRAQQRQQPKLLQ
eukprot:5902019-Amphidinium_carterae.1